MRKQYYFRKSPTGLLAWDVDRLVLLARALHVRPVPLSQIRELDESIHGDNEPVTWRSLVEHLELVNAADLSYPIILAADGCVMDGRHRVTKALLQGRSTIDAVQFAEDPPPDYVGKQPDELEY
ncbi:MAG TPA: hypothetical protein VGQ44_15310 [Gemmatimonadaceae bacterium]|jgi:hypothetical protein|nr:hypothetical protein [Gemmatimonadaceae bacterium]